MGPLFFSLYLIDLSEHLTDKSRVVQYADETLLFCNDGKVDDAVQITQEPCQRFFSVICKELFKTQNKHNCTDHF